ncbi:hypothetical protein Glove_48g169 [Diversispora epigaea]|uniref:Nudix hydrolase domain-containing protein n=1 Tax=Diversispora epigaea TaxID=1348612 RepID=A0A397JGC7_9GLOM|nr:hypothetical protein Glove_48g169 [Diversispora epigaea]
MYKALYFNEEAIRKEKEEEIKEYQGLFETYQKQEEERNEEPTFDEEVFNQILAELDITYNPEKVEQEKKIMEDLNNIKIKEYVSIILRRPNIPKIWVNKRINPNKEFYKHWQCPGGHVEDTNISTKHAALRKVLEETGIQPELEELEYMRTNHYF